MEKRNNLISEDFDSFFEELARKKGVVRYSDEYNDMVWSMLYELIGENKECLCLAG